eukprot:scaffold57271_cov58-Phaeocystis_antarctica.AAC.3
MLAFGVSIMSITYSQSDEVQTRLRPPLSTTPSRLTRRLSRKSDLACASSKVLGYDMVGLCAQGPQEKLDTTLYSQ